MDIDYQIRKSARSDFQQELLTSMCSPAGAIRPLAAFYDSKTRVGSLNGLCRRLSEIPGVSVYCLLDLPAFTCLRLFHPYPHIENYKWSPTLITPMTWTQQNDFDELCFEPEEILKEVLGNAYNPEEFESTKPFDESMIPWRLRCQKCGAECELEDEFDNEGGVRVAVCEGCRNKI